MKISVILLRFRLRDFVATLTVIRRTTLPHPKVGLLHLEQQRSPTAGRYGKDFVHFILSFLKQGR